MPRDRERNRVNNATWRTKKRQARYAPGGVLSEMQRAWICNALERGLSMSEVAEVLGVTMSMVRVAMRDIPEFGVAVDKAMITK